ncbi:hypothetical protein TI04_11215, partial [Achromatium sp. WMS2]
PAKRPLPSYTNFKYAYQVFVATNQALHPPQTNMVDFFVLPAEMGKANPAANYVAQHIIEDVVQVFAFVIGAKLFQ